MPEAQKARLRVALQEYVQAHVGDGRGHSAKHFGDVHLDDARSLADKLGGTHDTRGDTPGRRAAGSTGEGAPDFTPRTSESS